MSTISECYRADLSFLLLHSVSCFYSMEPCTLSPTCPVLEPSCRNIVGCPLPAGHMLICTAWRQAVDSYAITIHRCCHAHHDCKSFITFWLLKISDCSMGFFSLCFFFQFLDIFSISACCQWMRTFLFTVRPSSSPRQIVPSLDNPVWDKFIISNIATMYHCR